MVAFSLPMAKHRCPFQASRIDKLLLHQEFLPRVKLRSCCCPSCLGAWCWRGNVGAHDVPCPCHVFLLLASWWTLNRGIDRLERKTIGMTHHQHLSGASNTNYNAMTISSTSFIIARDEVRTGDARGRRVKKCSFEVRDELCRSAKSFAELARLSNPSEHPR